MTPVSSLPSGVGVALVTMFDPQGRVDLVATTRKAVACAERGVTSVLVSGTTGEAWRLSADDRIALASAVKEALPEVLVLVGTGDRQSTVALATTATVASAGVADALVVLAPGDTPSGPFYQAVRQEAPGLAVLAYHMPDVSPPGVATSEFPGLAVDGIKDSSGSADRLAELVTAGVEVYVGSPNLLSVAGRSGAIGALVALANVAPELCLAAWEGDGRAQRQIFDLHVATMKNFPDSLK